MAFNKINNFVLQLGLKQYDLNADALLLALARDTDPPTAADTVIGNITQTAGTGYAATDTLNTYNTTGTAVLQGTSFLLTNSGGGAWTSFQYPILYDDTHASDHLLCFWDYGSPLVLGVGETFSAKFANAAVGVAGNILTIT